MKYVEIYQLQNDGSQKTVVVCSLKDDGVSCDGDSNFVKNLELEGIIDYQSENSQKLYFKDGLRFLEQLKYNFKSGYLNASDVKEKE